MGLKGTTALSDDNQILYTVAMGLRELNKVLRSFPWESESAYGNFLSQVLPLLKDKEVFLPRLLTKIAPSSPEHAILTQGLLEETIGMNEIIKNDLKYLKIPWAETEFLATRIFLRNQRCILAGPQPVIGLGAVLFVDCALDSINKNFGTVIRATHGSLSSSFLNHHSEGLNIHVWSQILNNLKEQDATHAKDNILEAVFLFSALLKQCAF